MKPLDVLFVVVQVACIVFKLTGTVTCSWWLVFFPFLLLLGVAVVIFLILGITAYRHADDLKRAGDILELLNAQLKKVKL